jgi:replicative DNA helicase
MELTNPATERALLGCILYDNRILDEMRVTDSLFSDALNREVWQEISKAIARGNRADLVELRLRMPDKAVFIAGLTDCGSLVNGAQYFADLSELSKKRAFFDMAKGIAAHVKDECHSGQIADYCEKSLTEISEQTESGYKHVSAIIPDVIDQIEKAHALKGALSGIPTGFDKLDTMLNGWQPEYYVIGARPSTGKAQPLTAKIKTIDGWKLMGDITIGDKIASIDGNESIVYGVFPQGEKDIYKITFSDGRATECCAEHLWSVMYRDWEAQRVLETKELIQKMKAKRYKGRLFIDLASGDFGSSDTLPLDPWLLGVLLGDGKITEGNVIMSSADKPIIDRMRNILGETIELNYVGRYEYRLKKKQRDNGRDFVRLALDGLGLTGNDCYTKFIPEMYKLSSKKNRLELLNGLIATDGEISKEGFISYSSSSPQLAMDVRELVLSLGGICNINSRIPHFRYKGERKAGALNYRLSILVPNEMKGDILFLDRHISRINKSRTRLNRLTIESIKYVGKKEAQCIYVSHSSHTYITDDYIVTHNTAIALNCASSAINAKNPKTGLGYKVGFFSAEMSAASLIKRDISDRSSVDHSRIRSGFMASGDMAAIQEAMGELVEKGLYICDTSNITKTQLISEARKMRRKDKVDIIFIDYIGLISNENRDIPRHEQIADISRSLKGLSRELGIPLVALSQVTRDAEGKRPTMANIRESGSIEQDSDGIMFLWDNGTDDTSGNVQRITLIVAKQRNGPCGDIPLQFFKNKMRFRQAEVDKW